MESENRYASLNLNGPDYSHHRFQKQYIWAFQALLGETSWVNIFSPGF